jgi:branched-chain amino acid transport system substrate-binding protein
MKKNTRNFSRLAAFGVAAMMSVSLSANAAEPGITKNKILIGSYLPLQSGLAAGASQVKDGADAYFKYINDAGGIHGRKIEWTVENDSYNPQQTMAVAKKLVDRDGVFAIVSTLGTATNLAVFPYLTQRGVPVINAIGGHEKLNAPKDKNVFGMLPVGQVTGTDMAEYAINKLGAKRIAIFYQNDPFGKDPRDGSVEAMKKRGMTPVAEASYVPSDVDVSAQAVALQKAQPDVVLLDVITKQGAMFLKEAQRLGWRPKFISANTMGDPITVELAGPALEGVIVNLITAVETMDSPLVKKANEILAKYYPNTKPGYWAYTGMAGAIAFVEAAKRAGPDLTRAKLIASLESLGKFETGVVPPVNWSATNHGGPTKHGYAVWKNGKLTPLQGW